MQKRKNGLALSGQLRPVKGVLSIALEAKRRHRQTLIVPADNGEDETVHARICGALGDIRIPQT